MPVDVSSGVNVTQVSTQALALSTVTAILASRPGQAVLLLGDDGASGAPRGGFLFDGIGALQIPQGVTIVRGSTRAVASFAINVMPHPVVPGFVRAADRQGLMVSGYAPQGFEFLAADQDPVQESDQETALPAASGENADAADDEFLWGLAQRLDTVNSYESYLKRFADGNHSAEAKRLIANINGDPGRSDRLSEEALTLTRNQRRDVQRDLSLLEYDTRGIDGIFGPGSRRAIAGWQGDNDFDPSGYLTGLQITRLNTQAERRAVELELDAERLRLQQEEQDREYWLASGAGSDETGLRAYTKRYPDGLYAELAQERLKVYDDAKRSQAAQADREAWDQAITRDSLAGYRVYLQEFPRGAFADIARTNIDALSRASERSAALAAAKAGEDRLGLNQQTRALIETRLAAQGLKPGIPDGVFDANTRRAIRRYQTARKLPVTGYLSQRTVVRLLADAILR